jgi:AcrR family transcriptional regulator
MVVNLPNRSEPTRARILDAAHALFSERGSESVTVSEVAESAGVARATIFNQFGSKNGLVEAVTQSVFDGYVAILDNALADKHTPAPVLVRSLFEVMGSGIENDKLFYRAVFREIARVTVGLQEGGVAQRSRELAIDRLVQLLTRGQARAELTGELAAEDLAIAFDSLVFGTITHWLYDDASEALPARMLRAADVFLGNVALVAAKDFTGPEPQLSTEPRPGTNHLPRATARARRR